MQHNTSDILHHIPNIVNSVDLPSLKENIHSVLTSAGVKYYNYANLGATQNGHKVIFLYHNYEQSWLQKYTSNNYFSIDPTITKAKVTNNIFSWAEACEYANHFHYSKAKESLLHDMMNAVSQFGVEKGIAIPIISNIYDKYGFYFAFHTEEATQNIVLHNVLHALSVIINNAFHKFIPKEKSNTLTRNPQEDFPFTDREVELIKLIYLGKERIDIAEIMCISVNTIDTMTKRIFIKMRVNSKIQLITKIIAKGWIYMFM